MLLTIDIGNTSVGFCVFQGRRAFKKWRVQTLSCRNYKYLKNVMDARIGKKLKDEIEGVCIVSVVPKLSPIFRKACLKKFGRRPLFASNKMIGVPIEKYNRRQVGLDRLVNALAAHVKYKKAAIVVDAGTAITIDAVSAKGEFLGGAIAPGIDLSARALNEKTAKLPYVRVVKPHSKVLRSTQDAIKYGLYFGFAGLVDRIVLELSKEMRPKPIVIATGGHAKILAKASKTIQIVDQNLTQSGLRIIWESSR